jgi:aspartate racemase
MKKLGIVGGVAWPSTIEYYGAICRLSIAFHANKGISGPPPVPEMSIESLNINKSFGLRGNNANDNESWARYDEYFRDALQRLQKSGAEIAIIASNTPHNRFRSITRGIDIEVISIFDAVAKECNRLNIDELLILGTAPTMAMPVFSDTLKRFGVDGFAPTSEVDRESVVKLISELYADVSDNAGERIRRVVDNAMPETGKNRAVCLACTELPLAFPQIAKATSLSVDGVLYMNTTMIHAKAAFKALTT